jgi:hypothetical protein
MSSFWLAADKKEEQKDDQHPPHVIISKYCRENNINLF